MFDLECRTLDTPILQRWRPKIRDVAASFKKLNREFAWVKTEDKQHDEVLGEGILKCVQSCRYVDILLSVFFQERLENDDALIQHGKRLQAETKKTADITLRIVEDTKMVSQPSVELVVTFRFG